MPTPGGDVAVKKVLQHTCIRCGRGFPHAFTPRCPSCNGLVEVTYNLDQVRIGESGSTLERFVDLLPIRDPAHLLSLGEGGTRCLHAVELGRSFGLRQLYIKLESENPTGTTKDRMAAVVLSMFHELGIRDFVSCSTGNSSSALAHGITLHPHFRMHLYVGGEFRARVRWADGNPGVEVHVMDELNFTEAFNHAKAEAIRTGWAFEAGFFNPARREGLKLAYFEAVEQVPRPIEWYVQAVSSAMGVYGTFKGARELHALGRVPAPPRMVCVQQETCCPMAKAFEAGSPEIRPQDIVHHPTGIAKAILRGNPSGCYPYVYATVKSSGGTFVRVGEDEIIEAREQVSRLEGLACGYSAAATVAAVEHLAKRGTVAPDDVILLNLTD